MKNSPVIFLLLWGSSLVSTLPENLEDFIPDESNQIDNLRTVYHSQPSHSSSQVADGEPPNPSENPSTVTPPSMVTATSAHQAHDAEHSMLQAFLSSSVHNIPGIQPALSFVHRSSPSEDLGSSASVRSLLFGGTNRGRMLPLNVSELLHDQCQKRPFDQVVSHPGCLNTTVRSYYCYGVCSSIFVPMEQDFIQFCSSCLPVETRSVAVELTCPGREHKLRKRVKVIHTCSCLSCSSRGVFS